MERPTSRTPEREEFGYETNPGPLLRKPNVSLTCVGLFVRIVEEKRRRMEPSKLIIAIPIDRIKCDVPVRL